MDNNQDSIITKHLAGLVEDLERKLANPKNTWKRREELQAEIADAQKRLAVVSGRNRGRGTTRDRTSINRTDQGRGETPQKPARPRLLEVNYR